MGGRPTLIYSSRREAILQLSRDGLTPAQIADAINRSHPGARASAKAVGAYIGQLRAAGEAVPLSVRLERHQYDRLRQAAVARGSRTDLLLARLIGAILDDGLIDAVLDDAGAAA